MQRISLGDNNTNFFFRSVQVRRVRNKITCLNDPNKEPMEYVGQIGAACGYFY